MEENRNDSNQVLGQCMGGESTGRNHWKWGRVFGSLYGKLLRCKVPRIYEGGPKEDI